MHDKRDKSGGKSGESVKLNQKNGFVRFILRAVDVFVGFYIPRAVRWDKEPYQRATDSQKRFGGLFMAFFPALVLAFMAGRKQFEGSMDSMMYGHHSIFWLYAGVTVLVAGGGLFMAFVAPKIPLRASVPVAVLLWVILGWYVWSDLV